ncbi:hypothetical protein ACIBF5_29305 [Micromonospora sp. NPDC050417]|uniref:hypothetical protein n=1 Tax=Micromonospora sp. NPDC050417 TaxID=3364280 RepID=UPI00378FFF54
MRRPLPAAVITTALLTAVLLAGAGCAAERPRTQGQAPGATTSADPGASTPGVPGPSATPATPVPSNGAGAPSAGPGAPANPPNPLPSVTGPAGGNAKEVCTAALKTNTDSGTAFVTDLTAMMQATGDGDTAAATAAKTRVERGLANWTSALKEHSSKASDPTLKTVLTELATQIGSMKPELNSINEIRLDELNQRIETLCGV